MLSTPTSRARVALFGGVAVAGICLVLGGHLGSAGQPPAAAPAEPAAPAAPVAAAQPPKAPDERQPDQAAVEKALASFSAAFQKGDAKALAAQWTPDGEYFDDDG